jgi:hypothetical protein
MINIYLKINHLIYSKIYIYIYPQKKGLIITKKVNNPSLWPTGLQAVYKA